MAIPNYLDKRCDKCNHHCLHRVKLNDGKLKVTCAFCLHETLLPSKNDNKEDKENDNLA